MKKFLFNALSASVVRYFSVIFPVVLKFLIRFSMWLFMPVIVVSFLIRVSSGFH